MHAPSKPTARVGKVKPCRPEKITGYFGFVGPVMERTAYKQATQREIARDRAERETVRSLERIMEPA